ncbi:MAG: hypothetical protein ACTSRW_05915 [Candidatus Helarchaeota archaeon]
MDDVVEINIHLPKQLKETIEVLLGFHESNTITIKHQKRIDWMGFENIEDFLLYLIREKIIEYLLR